MDKRKDHEKSRAELAAEYWLAAGRKARLQLLRKHGCPRAWLATAEDARLNQLPPELRRAMTPDLLTGRIV